MNHRPFFLFAISLFILLIVPTLVRDGMFMDGQQYACVAKNLADGKGTFWQPFLSENWVKSGSNAFMEHPPLVYAMQAGYFKIFGDSMFTERIYSFTMALFSLLLIVSIWKLMLKDKTEYIHQYWVAVVFWISIPICFWSYQNNVQENTMGVFTLLATYLCLLYLKKKKNVLFLVTSGGCILLAALCKGLPGLFPLAVPFLYFAVYRDFSLSGMFIYSFAILISFIGLLFLLLLKTEAYESLHFYITERVLYRIGNEPTTDSRLFIITRLFAEMLLPLIVVVFVKSISYFKSEKPEHSTEMKNGLFFVLIGLSASLPMLLTPVQRGFYLLPAFPFYAIGFSMMILPEITRFTNYITRKETGLKIVKVFAGSLFIFTIAFSVYSVNKPGRDATILHDVYLLGEQLPKNKMVSIEPFLVEEWSFQFYMIRHFGIAFIHDGGHQEYYIQRKTSTETIPPGFHPVILETERYLLFTRLH